MCPRSPCMSGHNSAGVCNPVACQYDPDWVHHGMHEHLVSRPKSFLVLIATVSLHGHTTNYWSGFFGESLRE